jgi:uncharacterized membrane protein
MRGVAVLIYLVMLVVWLWGLIDAARRPDTAYQAAGQNKVLWIVLCVVLGALGSLIYLLAIRPKVAAASSG